MQLSLLFGPINYYTYVGRLSRFPTVSGASLVTNYSGTYSAHLEIALGLESHTGKIHDGKRPIGNIAVYIGEYSAFPSVSNIFSLPPKQQISPLYSTSTIETVGISWVPCVPNSARMN